MLVLIRGLAIVGVVIAGLFAWHTHSAHNRNAEAAMPTLEIADAPGTFEMVSSTAFYVRHLKTYEFEVAEATRAAATAQQTLDGTQPVTWHYFVPETDEKVPLVVLFHGRDREGLSLIELWLDTARRENIAIIAPTAPSGSWPYTKPSPQFVNRIISEVAKSHPIDQEQIYLFGHSAGAVYTHVLLNTTQGPWKAAVLHGGFMPADYLITPAMPKPYRAYIGQHERGFERSAIRATGEEMARRGHDNDLIIIPAHTHWIYDIGDQIAADSWRWFQSLPQL
ncbi:hypothetical protein [Shimia sp. MMG029]|uniref:hypothetical protein n=1 Tax=Shimia sp. MMG029 TaxID=3021978 RepID=UPI0022FEF83B|nr:hypothetical protein [Shimia sp. MMG029]MDA5558843.1 hypothetical protein [Shimia sp. MMG029]